MTQWRFQAGITTTIDDGGADKFFAINSGGPVGGTTEADHQLKIYTAYTFSDLRVKVTTMVAGANVLLRDDGVSSSNVSVALVASSWVEDVTGSDTPDANSLMNFILEETGAMHGDDVTVTASLISYEHATTDAPMQGTTVEDINTGDRFSPLGPDNFHTTTEAEAQIKVKRSQSASNLQMFVLSESSINYEGTVRTGGSSSTNLTVTLNGTGLFEDATGSESFSSGDLINFGFIFTGGSGNLAMVAVDFDTAEQFWVSGREQAFTTRQYAAFSAVNGSTSTDDNYTAHMGSTTAANLQTYVTTEGSGTRDVSLRTGTTNSTNVTISVTGTGLFEDTTGSEAIADAENVVATMASTSGEVRISLVAVELPFSSADVDTGEAQPFPNEAPGAWSRRVLTLAYLIGD